jgi:hypothetical protein
MKLWAGSIRCQKGNKMARKDEVGQDSEGRYRRYIGWKDNNSDRYIQHLFRLGRNREEAQRRNMRLERLWDCVVALWKLHKANGKTDAPCPLWDEYTLAIGQAIAKGAEVCTLTAPPGVQPGIALEWLAIMRQWYPVIPLKLREDIAKAGVEEIERRRSTLESSRRLHEKALEAAGVSVAGTLHLALDAYGDYVRQKYKDKPSLHPQLTTLALLKRHLADAGLGGLDADAIEQMLAYWSRRPEGDKGKPLAVTTCRNAGIVTRQFLRWLSRSPRFDWSLPGGFTFPRTRITVLPADNADKLRRKYFKVEELKVLWEYAYPWERALMLLALNCGFANREVATLQSAEVVRGNKYSFIKRHRGKTGVYGEWVLWPETAQALEYLGQFRPEGLPFVVADRDGKPLTERMKSDNKNDTIARHWKRILERVGADHPGFHQLSFKFLRKTGATLLRHLHVPNAAELASMYLAHGEASDSRDSLLPAYAVRPWKKLHRALLKLRKKLLPVLTGVEKPWEGRGTRISPAKVAEVKKLRAGGMTLTEIAARVGLHHVTVGKLCRT